MQGSEPNVYVASEPHKFCEGKTNLDGSNGGQKRKRVDNNVEIDSRHANLCINNNVSSCSIICDKIPRDIPYQIDETEASSRCNPLIDNLPAAASTSNFEEGASVGTPMNSSDGAAPSNDSCDGGIEELVDEFMAPSSNGTPLPTVAQSKSIVRFSFTRLVKASG
ncbi:poly(A) polymerase type 3-like [Pyrus ussuriensis x Pyrus communis]|uniref:Poly(A) polymerase type 3-like n=1 Tax=Pyrus ussuriensis x Pyrus communis TaxID=2448454 RepID=A0A5N5HKL2_9ROSA|nr:poly(A) polymerase type 3-like [Pyrus ussuriensis x Pyrus communis]KAB2623804.1 poly(A) polymerase type 3-like [Pyrus ussuriensis x Pyrus communis]